MEGKKNVENDDEVVEVESIEELDLEIQKLKEQKLYSECMKYIEKGIIYKAYTLVKTAQK